MKLFFLLCLVGVTAASVLKTNESQSRIIGGTPVQTLADFPWMVSIQISDSHKCGGAAIGKRWVMTAARCVLGLSPRQLQIRYNTLIVNVGGKKVGVTDIISHPQYDSIHYKNNIALIHTAEDLDIVRLAAIPCDTNIMLNAFLQFAGWGTLRDGSSSMVVDLQYMQIPYLELMCREYHLNLGIEVDETMFCAGEFYHGGIGLCSGDEGGAAIRPGTNLAYGIGSFHEGCGQARLTSVFLKVSKYASWIQQTTTIQCVSE